MVAAVVLSGCGAVAPLVPAPEMVYLLEPVYVADIPW
jgi:hypothetical protein